MDRRALTAFVGFIVLGGANGTAVAFSNQELAPFWGGAMRFLLSAWVFLAVALLTKRKFPRGRALLGTVLYGLFAFGGTFGFIYWAFQFVKPGLGQVILALAPLMTFFLAMTQRLEKFRWSALAGGIASIAGIAYIFQGQFSADVPLKGLLALLGAALCIAQASVLSKRFPRADVVTTNVVAMATAALLLFAVSLASSEPRILPSQRSTWIALAYLVLIGSVVAFALYLFVLHHWSASATSYQWVALPLVAVPVSAFFTHEPITTHLLLGGLLVLGGVYLGALWKPGAGTKIIAAPELPKRPRRT